MMTRKEKRELKFAPFSKSRKKYRHPSMYPGIALQIAFARKESESARDEDFRCFTKHVVLSLTDGGYYIQEGYTKEGFIETVKGPRFALRDYLFEFTH